MNELGDDNNDINNFFNLFIYFQISNFLQDPP
jgi:hypothetical protein